MEANTCGAPCPQERGGETKTDVCVWLAFASPKATHQQRPPNQGAGVAKPLLPLCCNRPPSLGWVGGGAGQGHIKRAQEKRQEAQKTKKKKRLSGSLAGARRAARSGSTDLPLELARASRRTCSKSAWAKDNMAMHMHTCAFPTHTTPPPTQQQPPSLDWTTRARPFLSRPAPSSNPKARQQRKVSSSPTKQQPSWRSRPAAAVLPRPPPATTSCRATRTCGSRYAHVPPCTHSLLRRLFRPSNHQPIPT